MQSPQVLPGHALPRARIPNGLGGDQDRVVLYRATCGVGLIIDPVHDTALMYLVSCSCGNRLLHWLGWGIIRADDIPLKGIIGLPPTMC